MSLRWITKVWDSSPYDGSALLIHLGMADHADDEGRFFLSQATLSKKARCSVEYVRKITKRMQTDNLLLIEKKGSSKGRATEYRLLPITVGQSAETHSPTLIEPLPNSDSALPNSTQYQPSYTTTITPTVEEPSKEGWLAADRWWREQNPRPLGKRSWHILLKVTNAADERGYTKEQIYEALNRIGSVPSMVQMDRQLRGVVPNRSKRQERLSRGLEAINNFEKAETELWQLEA